MTATHNDNVPKEGAATCLTRLSTSVHQGVYAIDSVTGHEPCHAVSQKDAASLDKLKSDKQGNS